VTNVNRTEHIGRFVKERTNKLRTTNERLEHEIAIRTQAEKDLQKVHDDLEIRVKERTEELSNANKRLRLEISERKRMEKALHGAYQNWENTFHSISDGIWLLDPERRILQSNGRFEELLGIRAESVIGKHCYETVHCTSNFIESCPFEKMLLTGRRESLELEDKERAVWLQVTVDPNYDKSGVINGCIHIVRDITDRKQAEKEKAVLEEQLRQSQKMEAIGRLAGGIAHDFNNILTVISGNCQLSLLDLKECDRLKENIEEIKNAAERASILIRQLLAFGRRQILEMEVTDLNTLLQNLCKLLHRIIGEDIELIIELSNDLGRVKIDQGQIEQVILNLVVNGKDAMPRGGKLTISTGNVELDEGYTRIHSGVTPGCYVMFSVSDTGMGMSPDVKERIFEPFFTTKEKGKGTGLGLSTVYGIIKQHGGHIWVYSEPGQGTTFRIYLPWVDEPLEAFKEKKDFAEITPGEEAILLVEDEDAVRKVACTILEKNGYTVLECANGEQALRVVREQINKSIHLIITDVVMPGMSGRELTKQLEAIHPGIKKLYISGYADDTISHYGILEPQTALLKKPFTMDSLLRRVREILDSNEYVKRNSIPGEKTSKIEKKLTA
jgi:two-component system cell cycle sensor histidine kinase/response regulator CckA